MSHFEDTDILITPKEFLDAWIKNEQHRADLEEVINDIKHPKQELILEYEMVKSQSARIAFGFYNRFNCHIDDEFYSGLDIKVSNRKVYNKKLLSADDLGL